MVRLHLSLSQFLGLVLLGHLAINAFATTLLLLASGNRWAYLKGQELDFQLDLEQDYRGQSYY